MLYERPLVQIQDKHFSSQKGMQLMVANIAANSFIINNLFMCKIYNQKLQILHQ